MGNTEGSSDKEATAAGPASTQIRARPASTACSRLVGRPGLASFRDRRPTNPEHKTRCGDGRFHRCTPTYDRDYWFNYG